MLYGCGIRKAELLKLRVKDIDSATKNAFVFRGKGGKDRVTMLHNNLTASLQSQIETVRQIYQKELAEGEKNDFAYRISEKIPYANKEFK